MDDNLLQIDNHDTVEMGSDAEVKWISHLLELSDDWLKQALTQKVTVSFHQPSIDEQCLYRKIEIKIWVLNTYVS